MIAWLSDEPDEHRTFPHVLVWSWMTHPCGHIFSMPQSQAVGADRSEARPSHEAVMAMLASAPVPHESPTHPHSGDRPE